ncbi:MAG: hypothetical protein WCK84_13960 [Bacteroidota bacterium]
MKKQDRNLRQEEMTHHIQCWKESGQSQKQFCLTNNLRFHTFYYWLKKDRKQINPLTGGFIPIRVQGLATNTDSNIEIQYPNGVRILVPSMDIQFIGHLVRLV